MWKLFSAAVYFGALAGLAGASTEPPSPHQDHFENAWVAGVLFVLVALNGWMYWYLWKNRAPEEEPGIKVMNPAHRPVIQTQTPIQRKRASRERTKITV